MLSWQRKMCVKKPPKMWELNLQFCKPHQNQEKQTHIWKTIGKENKSNELTINVTYFRKNALSFNIKRQFSA